jgi:hypothetical protein
MTPWMSSILLIFFSIMVMTIIIWHKIFFFTGGWNTIVKNMSIVIAVLAVAISIATNAITNLYSPVILWLIGPPIILTFTALYGFWE